MVVICLLAASFTGCLADDKTTDEKIEPTGGSDDGGMNSPSDNNTADKNGTDSNITIRYDHSSGSIANFSKMGNTVHVIFDAETRFAQAIWFYDTSGNEIRHTQLYNRYDNCYSNGNWSAWDSNGSADCIETYEQEDSNGILTNSTAVTWEFNLAREPQSVALGNMFSYYWLDSF